MAQRRLDIGDDIGRDVELPTRVVDVERIVGVVFVVEKPFDGRTPKQRAERHLSGALLQQLHDVGRIFRGHRQAGVLEAIDAGLESDADFVRPVTMGDHRKFPEVRFVDDGHDLLLRHLILVDQLDHIDAGVGEPLDLGAAIGGALHAPTKILGARIGRVLDEGTGDIESRAGDFAARDSLPHIDARPERRAEIRGAGHPGHQQLAGGRRHDLFFEAGGIGLVPVIVVGVAQQHRVDVIVPQTGQDGHAIGPDHLGIGGDGQGVNGADGLDPVVLDEDDAVIDGCVAPAVD